MPRARSSLRCCALPRRRASGAPRQRYRGATSPALERSRPRASARAVSRCRLPVDVLEAAGFAQLAPVAGHDPTRVTIAGRGREAHRSPVDVLEPSRLADLAPGSTHGRGLFARERAVIVAALTLGEAAAIGSAEAFGAARTFGAVVPRGAVVRVSSVVVLVPVDVLEARLAA